MVRPRSTFLFWIDVMFHSERVSQSYKRVKLSRMPGLYKGEVKTSPTNAKLESITD